MPPLTYSKLFHLQSNISYRQSTMLMISRCQSLLLLLTWVCRFNASKLKQSCSKAVFFFSSKKGHDLLNHFLTPFEQIFRIQCISCVFFIYISICMGYLEAVYLWHILQLKIYLFSYFKWQTETSSYYVQSFSLWSVLYFPSVWFIHY